MARLKVLISAFACRPGEGSEPGKGWACARAMAKHHDVWVLTRGRYRDLIEEGMTQAPVAGLSFEYLDLPDWILRATKPSHSFQFFYYMWQLAAYFRARRLRRKIDFDVVHHVSYSKYWAPSFVSLLPVPFIWGPVGGGETTPGGFGRRYSWRGIAYETLRDFGRWLGEHDPFVKLTARRSAVALATTSDSAERMRRLGAHPVSVYPAIGVTHDDLVSFDAIPSNNDNSVRFLSVGRLLHWKGFDLGISAFAKADTANAEFWIVGDGPERSRLEALVAHHGIGDRVKFFGRLTRAETLKVLGDSDVLVHPSLHESGGLVCLEAMAARRPVLCLDLGGPSIQVAEGTGIRVPVGDPDQVVADLSNAMTQLAKNGDLRKAMGTAGRRHVEEHYLWPKKVEHYCGLYAKA